MTSQQEFVADLHIHSRYAYACSKNLTLANIAEAAKVKGIGLLATGDFTHPAWVDELTATLLRWTGGLTSTKESTLFWVRRSVAFTGREARLGGCTFCFSCRRWKRLRDSTGSYPGAASNWKETGVPSVGTSAAELTCLALDVDPAAMVIPAHIWTPWYGLLGSVSGFDSLEECFGDLTAEIRAVETGLSSDPAMNWGVSEMAGRAIVSFSDAHSLPNLGREVTVFRGRPTYDGLKAAVDQNAIAYTIEFYPEEGKYHYNGHRNCGVRQSPGETAAMGSGRCPVCNRPLTLGVLHRVDALSSTSGTARDADPTPGPDGFISPPDERPPFLRLVPLEELLAEILGVGRRTKTVANMYRRICAELGSELDVLAHARPEDIRHVAGDQVAQAVLKARTGQVVTEPGFDGQYGSVRVWAESPGDVEQRVLF